MPPRLAHLSPPLSVPPSDPRHPWAKLSHIDVGDRIPGYKTSAVFFTSLRANLLLAESSASPDPSPYQEPVHSHHSNAAAINSASGQHHLQRPPSPLSLATRHAHNDAPSNIQLPARITSPPPMSVGPQVPTNLRKPRPQASTPPAVPTTLRWLHQPDPTTGYQSHTLTRALGLLSTSVSNQRHLAFRALLFHPLNLFIWFLLLFLARKTICFLSPMACQNTSFIPYASAPVAPPQYRAVVGHAYPYAAQAAHAQSHEMCGAASAGAGVHPDTGLDEDDIIYDVQHAVRLLPVRVLLVWAALSVALLVGARFASLSYCPEGRAVREQGWLRDEDEVLVAFAPKAGGRSLDRLEKPLAGSGPFDADEHDSSDEEDEEIVGVLVMSWVPGQSKCATRKRKIGKGFLRGWAVKPEWQGRGIGREMLKDAVRVCMRERGADSVWISDDFAHSARPLHRIYNKSLDRRDRRARAALMLAINEVTSRNTWAGHVRRRS